MSVTDQIIVPAGRAAPADEPALPHRRMLIDGVAVDSAERYRVLDPATERVIGTVARAGTGHADAAVAAAARTFRERRWRDTPAAERAAVFDRAAGLLAARAEELSALITAETGLPLRAARAFAGVAPAAHLRHYAELTRAFAWERPVPGTEPDGAAVIRKEPLGVCVGICPWNLPATIAVWKTVPALAAGNSVVLKADEKAPLFALELAAALHDAGLPGGVLNVVVGDGAIGDHLVRHPDVAMVSFTGSTATGRRVMAAAAPTVKRLHLELGGKSPSIVLDDADLDLAVDGTIYGFVLHAGQACESGTRVLVPDALHDEFVARLTDRLATLRYGDTTDPDTDLGPVMTAAQRDRILGYIESARAEGAELVCGGGIPDHPVCAAGYWIEPTVFTGVHGDMRIAREEVFGPVLAITRYTDVEEAIAVANDTEFGLAAGVWSTDRERAEAVARRLDAGSVWINDWHDIDVRLPFGGYKQSGVGRELGPDALLEFTQDQAISVHPSAAQPRAAFALVLPAVPQ